MRLLNNCLSDGSVIVKHRDALLNIVKLLSSRCFSKRAYSWTGKFLTSMLITLSHTYPLENKFVNPDEWNSEGTCRRNQLSLD